MAFPVTNLFNWAICVNTCVTFNLTLFCLYNKLNLRANVLAPLPFDHWKPLQATLKVRLRTAKIFHIFTETHLPGLVLIIYYVSSKGHENCITTLEVVDGCNWSELLAPTPTMPFNGEVSVFQ